MTVRIADRTFDARARVVEGDGEDARARDLVFEKYAPTYSGDLTDWRQDSLPIAVDLASA